LLPSHSPPTACRHTVSGTISLPSQGFFSPFPHGTGSLSVAGEYLALRDGPRRFPRDFTCPVVLRNLSNEPACFRLPDFHRLWSTVPDRSTNMLVSHSPALRPNRPYNPEVHALRFGLFRVRSPLLAESLLFSIPGGTEMVHFPPLPSPAYVFSRRYGGITRRGFPHSDIPGSKLICSSPRLIAAYRVLHRLPAPRHSPYALSSLTIGIVAELTRTPVCIRRRPRQFFFLTLALLSVLEFVDQIKTTVCRIFSCQRTPEGANAVGKTPARSRIARGPAVRTCRPPSSSARCARDFGGQPSQPARLARQP
jgi:hypothetical protein